MQIQKNSKSLRKAVLISFLGMMFVIAFSPVFFPQFQLRHSSASASFVNAIRSWTGAPGNYSAGTHIALTIAGVSVGNQFVLIIQYEAGEGTTINDTMGNTFFTAATASGSGTNEAVFVGGVTSIIGSGTDTVNLYFTSDFISASLTQLSGANVSAASAITSFGNGGGFATNCAVSSVSVPVDYIVFQTCQVPDSFLYSFSPTAGFSSLVTGGSVNDQICGTISTIKCDALGAWRIMPSTQTSTFPMNYVYSRGHNTELLVAFPPLVAGCGVYACTTTIFSISFVNDTCVAPTGCTLTTTYTIVSYDNTSTNATILYCDSETNCVHFTQSFNKTVTYTDTSVSFVTSTVTTTSTQTQFNAPNQDSFQFWAVPLMFNLMLAALFVAIPAALNVGNSFLYGLMFSSGLTFGGIFGLLAHVTPWYDPVVCGLMLVAVLVTKAL